MNTILAIAVKDLRLLLRDKMAAFFVLGFPILMGVFFGLIMGVGNNESRGKMKVAIVDEDHSDISRMFIDSLANNKSIEIENLNRDAAQESVRRGSRVGMLIIPNGFEKTAGIMWEKPPSIQLGVDPSRAAESAMLQGFIMEAMGQLVGHRFQNPDQFKPMIEKTLAQIQNDPEINPLQRSLLSGLFGSLTKVLDTTKELQDQAVDGVTTGSQAQGPSMQFADIQQLDVMREVDPNSIQAQVKKLRSRWDISFPQAMMWGVLGCIAGFSLSIARERTQGTLLRLRVAPISQLNLLCGKALACFLAALGVIALLNGLGYFLGMRPVSFSKLIATSVLISFCFVGIMMTLSTLGKTEESVGGIGWAANMVMAMIGGCMIPAMFMPAFMQRLGVISPVFWSIRALEGSIWRDFTWNELAVPFAVLLAFGAAGLLIGTSIITRQNQA